MTNRRGIALIELIIAIVVMAVALAGVPLMMQKASEADTVAVQQEAIMLAATQMSNIATLQWDEQETNITKNGGYAKILDVQDNGGTAFNFTRWGGTDYRVGAVTMNADKALFRRRFYNVVTNASALGIDAGENANDTTTFDDIDDFNGYNYTLNRTLANADYKFDYDIAVTVQYHNNAITNNAAPAGTSNVKFVTVRVRETAMNETNVSLIAFMSNIGETKMLAKVLSW